MTLVLILANRDQVIMLADRRLTAGGQPVEEDAGKLGVIGLANANFSFGFSGLARAGLFDTRRWLLTALQECAAPDYQAGTMLERFTLRATKDFATLPALRDLPPDQKRLAVLFGGYIRHYSPPLIGVAVVSNMHATSDGEFVLTPVLERREPHQENPTYMRGIGMTAGCRLRHAVALRGLLERRKPYKGIVGKAIEVIHDMADRPSAQQAVGKRIIWVRLPMDSTEPTDEGYYSDVPSHDNYFVDRILFNGRGTGIVMGLKIESVDRHLPPSSSLPRVRRNAPCPCKSGKRYKQCHGGKPFR